MNLHISRDFLRTLNVNVIFMLSRFLLELIRSNPTDFPFNSHSRDLRCQIWCRKVPENQFCFMMLLSLIVQSESLKLLLQMIEFLRHVFPFSCHRNAWSSRVLRRGELWTNKFQWYTEPSLRFPSGYHVNGIIFSLPIYSGKRNQKKIECRKMFIYFAFSSPFPHRCEWNIHFQFNTLLCFQCIRWNKTKYFLFILHCPKVKSNKERKKIKENKFKQIVNPSSKMEKKIVKREEYYVALFIEARLAKNCRWKRSFEFCFGIKVLELEKAWFPEKLPERKAQIENFKLFSNKF